jgi:hypothetical protein
MDIFKFLNPTNAMKMEQGQIVNDLKSKMWIERYGKEGEFTLTGEANSGLRDILPEGTFISHVDTDEIMIVENHEIDSTRDTEAEIKITGRSFETLLEQRVSEPPRAYPFVDGSQDYEIAADEPHQQIVTFIKKLITAGSVFYADDAIPYVTVYTWLPNGTIADELLIEHGETGLETAHKLLNGEGLDLRAYRPGPLSRTDAAIPDDHTTLAVHSGTDRSATAVLSYDLGEIENAQYFFSQKPFKTMAVVQGKWVGVRVSLPGTYTGKDRRMLFVDGTGMDDLYNVAPTGAALTKIQTAMARRGLQVLNAQKEVNLVNVNVSKEGTHLTYRKDYHVGDIIMVNGEYNTSAPFRVSEYVEIEDENGVSGYPTLVVP